MIQLKVLEGNNEQSVDCESMFVVYTDKDGQRHMMFRGKAPTVDKTLVNLLMLKLLK